MLCGAELKIMSGCHKGIEWKCKTRAERRHFAFCFFADSGGRGKKGTREENVPCDDKRLRHTMMNKTSHLHNDILLPIFPILAD
jgi:hypothetical protein